MRYVPKRRDGTSKIGVANVTPRHPLNGNGNVSQMDFVMGFSRNRMNNDAS